VANGAIAANDNKVRTSVVRSDRSERQFTALSAEMWVVQHWFRRDPNSHFFDWMLALIEKW